MKRIAFTIIFFLFASIPSFAVGKGIVVRTFNPLVALPKTSISIGSAVVDCEGKDKLFIAFKNNRDVFVLVPDKLELSQMPVLTITSIGYFDDRVIIGASKGMGSRGSWVFLLSVTNSDVQLLDYIRHGQLDGYDYDFYFDLPSVDAPKKLKMINDPKSGKKADISLDFYLRKFRMRLAIGESKLSLDLNSKYYNDEYGRVKSIEGLDEYQFREHILYGLMLNKMKRQEALKTYTDNSQKFMTVIPDIIASTIEVKHLSDRYGITGIVVDFILGDVSAGTVSDELQNIGNNEQEIYDFIDLLLKLDDKLKSAKMDEEAFNDFVMYFMGSINENEFRQFASKSLVNLNGDVFSILSNYNDLNSALHSGFPLKIVKLRI